MITRQLLIDVKRVIEQVSAIRKGRYRHELSEQEKALIKEIYDSSYELYELFDYLGFGYRKESPNKVSRACDYFCNKVRDETVFIMYYWDDLEEKILMWDEQDEKELLARIEYTYKRAQRRMYKKVVKDEDEEGRQRDEKEEEAYRQMLQETPQVVTHTSRSEEREGVKALISKIQKLKIRKEGQKVLPDFIDYLMKEFVQGNKSRVTFNMFYEKMAEKYGGEVDSYRKLIMRIRKRLMEEIGSQLNTTYNRRKISFFDPSTLERNKQRNQFYTRYEGKTQKITYRNLAGFTQTFWEYPVKTYQISG